MYIFVSYLYFKNINKTIAENIFSHLISNNYDCYLVFVMMHLIFKKVFFARKICNMRLCQYLL